MFSDSDVRSQLQINARKVSAGKRIAIERGAFDGVQVRVKHVEPRRHSLSDILTAQARTDLQRFRDWLPTDRSDGPDDRVPASEIAA